MKQAVQERAVFEEELAEVRINGKNAVSVRDINQFKGHGSSAAHGVEVAAGGTEPAVTAEGDEFQFSAVRAAEHSTAEGRIPTVDHFLHVVNDSGTRM